jgi:hypothetical protein
MPWSTEIKIVRTIIGRRAMRLVGGVAILVFLFFSQMVLAQADPVQPALEAIQARDYARAATLLEPLARGGNPGAQQLLAGLYENGLGVPRNLATAASWYEESARLGLAFGQLMIGDMLMVGAGVARDPDKALEWYRRAAEQGYAEAEFRVAMLLHEGEVIGGPYTSRSPAEDLLEAISWYKKASAHGVERALLRLNAIVPNEIWGGDAVDAFTLVEARAAVIAATSSRALEGKPIKLAYLPLGAGIMVSPGWDPEHAGDVAELAALVVSKAQVKLKSAEHAYLPKDLLVVSAGKCEPDAKALTSLFVDDVLLNSSADPSKSAWFGAIEGDHIVIGTSYSDIDEYYGLITFYAHAYYGIWREGSAELWNPTRSCSITLSAH